MADEMTPETLALVKRFEGWCRVLPDGRAAPYLCPAGVWTIGWGSTRDGAGRAVTAATPPIPVEEGEALLARDLSFAATAVRGLVGVRLNDFQFGALTSFVFNLGPSRLKASTLLRRLNAGEVEEAAEEFPKWVMAGGRVLPGLVARRQAERALFLAVPRAEAVAGAEAPAKGRVGRFLAAFRGAAARAA